MPQVTKEGILLIQEFEGCALTAYFDPRGNCWTIGWGRTKDVKEGDTCAQDQADGWLKKEVQDLSALILRLAPNVQLNDNQLSALVSFVYNVGLGKKGEKAGFLELISGEPSTLLKCLRRGDLTWAAVEFPKWDKAGGQISAGILRRRLAEQALFLKEVGDGSS